MTGNTKTTGALSPDDLDYDEIEAAVLETDRGRWFLGEFARRNRHAETEGLLAAIKQLQTSMAPPDESAGMRQVICEMADEIAAAKKEIASIRGPENSKHDIADATAELDAIVESTETATSDILGAAEQIQELAWTLREQGAPSEFCDALDERATDIYTACSFQDITGQRTTKVVQVLQSLENRINAMARLWSGDTTTSGAEASSTQACEDTLLLNGPARDGEGVDQDSVDRMIAEMDGVAPADDSAEHQELNEVTGIITNIGDSAETPPTAATPKNTQFAADTEVEDSANDDVFFGEVEPVKDAAPDSNAQDSNGSAKQSDETSPENFTDLPELSEKDYEALFS